MPTKDAREWLLPGYYQYPILVYGYTTTNTGKVEEMFETVAFSFLDSTLVGNYSSYNPASDYISSFIIGSGPNIVGALLNATVPIAQKCTLRWCGQTLHSESISAKLVEDVIQEVYYSSNDAEAGEPNSTGSDSPKDIKIAISAPMS